MKLFNFKNILAVLITLLISTVSTYAEEPAKSASINFSIGVSPYIQITTLTSPVLVANVTDRTGNLHAPLYSKFRVISNGSETKTLYLKATTNTDNGAEPAIFEMGGRVYVAFANVSSVPKSSSLFNCKHSAHPDESPGIVAYPITSIVGAKHEYVRRQGKYEVYVDNGTTDITVNVGSQVLKNSFGKNDPKGFYQATLSLTETDL